MDGQTKNEQRSGALRWPVATVYRPLDDNNDNSEHTNTLSFIIVNTNEDPEFLY